VSSPNTTNPSRRHGKIDRPVGRSLGGPMGCVRACSAAGGWTPSGASGCEDSEMALCAVVVAAGITGVVGLWTGFIAV